LQLEKIRNAAERVARSEGLEVVDVEWKVGKQRFLRVYIDRVPPLPEEPSPQRNLAEPPGPSPAVSHADCERVSKQLSVILDVEELIPGPGYVLEVSSPGMDRALRHIGDYRRFVGRAAKIWTDEPVEEMKFFEGRLAGVVENRISESAAAVPGILKVRLELKGKTPRMLEIPLALIRKAHLVVEF
jgi:ribosome maturation factor RimP